MAECLSGLIGLIDLLSGDLDFLGDLLPGGSDSPVCLTGHWSEVVLNV